MTQHLGLIAYPNPPAVAVDSLQLTTYDSRLTNTIVVATRGFEEPWA
jgi:hypothetical protein